MTWTLRDIENDREIVRAIDGHDDRAAAILAGAYLEDRLLATIKTRLVSDGKALKRFFTGIGPLVTFSAKIDLSYLLGIFDPKTTEILHIVRSIRNEFAHNLSPISFSTPVIAKLCNRLFYSEKIKDLKSTNEVAFQNCPALLEMNTVLLSPLVELSNTPRNAYMNTIKVLLFMMELSKASVSMRETDTLQIISRQD